VLTVVACGTALGFSTLLLADRFALLVPCLMGYAFFNSAVTPLIDSLTLQRVSAKGGSFAYLRVFGSMGFVLSSSAFGFAVAGPDRSTVAVPLVFMALFFLWSFTLRARSTPAPLSSPLAGLLLAKRPEIGLMLAATCMHWIACAPFHGMFSVHVDALGLPPSVVGTSAALGVLAEVAVMFLYPVFGDRISPPKLLVVALLASGVRWAGMALAVRPGAIVALSLLHGMSFGAFYMAVVAHLGKHVPTHLRASGQSLFASATFGVGGLVGYLGAGAGYDLLGGHRLFGVGAALELVAAGFAWALTRLPSERQGTGTA
jgi:PPP family 3-phenylpropionic acid transporter